MSVTEGKKFSVKFPPYFSLYGGLKLRLFLKQNSFASLRVPLQGLIVPLRRNKQ